MKLEFNKYQSQYRANNHEDLFGDCSDSRQTWKNINSLLGKSNGKKQAVSLKDGNVVIDEGMASECFNEFFASVGSDLSNGIPETDQDDLNEFNTLSVNPLSIFFDPVTEGKVHSIISSMNIDKSPGFDGISVGSLKCCAPSISSFFLRCVSRRAENCENSPYF